MKTEIRIDELLPTDFKVNEEGKFVSEVDLKRLNMIADILASQQEEIERLNNIIDKKEQFLGDNIKRLEREVVKRDNIIKEVREYIEKYDFITGFYDSNYDNVNDTYSHDIVKEELLEILDKGE